MFAVANSSCPDVASAASAAIHPLSIPWMLEMLSTAGMGFRAIPGGGGGGETFSTAVGRGNSSFQATLWLGELQPRRNCWAAFLIPAQRPPGSAAFLVFLVSL